MRDLKQFEARGLPAEEVAQTLDSITRTFKDGSQINVPESDRMLALQTEVQHLADPDSIWDGKHYTCGATSIEFMLMKSSPHLAAGILEHSLRNGSWTEPNGNKIEVVVPDNAGIGKPQPFGKAEEAFFPTRDNKRTFASLVLNSAITNGAVQLDAPAMRYVEQNQIYVDDISGDGPIEKAWWINTKDPKAEPEPFTGQKYDPFGEISAGMLANQLDLLMPGQKVMVHESQKDQFKGKDENITYLSDQNFENELAAKKRDGNLLAMFGVDSAKYIAALNRTGTLPMKIMATNGEAAGGVDHFVVVDDYAPGANGKPGLVHVANWWGQLGKGWVRSDLFLSALRKESAERE
jgi:hypothetical protein